MAKKHQYKISNKTTRRKANRSWRSDEKEKLNKIVKTKNNRIKQKKRKKRIEKEYKPKLSYFTIEEILELAFGKDDKSSETSKPD